MGRHQEMNWKMLVSQGTGNLQLTLNVEITLNDDDELVINVMCWLP